MAQYCCAKTCILGAEEKWQAAHDTITVFVIITSDGLRCLSRYSSRDVFRSVNGPHLSMNDKFHSQKAAGLKRQTHLGAIVNLNKYASLQTLSSMGS